MCLRKLEIDEFIVDGDRYRFDEKFKLATVTIGKKWSLEMPTYYRRFVGCECDKIKEY